MPASNPDPAPGPKPPRTVTFPRENRAVSRGSRRHDSCYCPSTTPQARDASALATSIMRISDFPFHKLGEHAGMVLLRTALVLALLFALVNAFQG